MFDQSTPPSTIRQTRSQRVRGLYLVPFSLRALSPALADLARSTRDEPRLVSLDADDTPTDLAHGATPTEQLLGTVAGDDTEALAVIEPTPGRAVVSVVYRNGTSFRADVAAGATSAPVITLYGSTDRAVDAMRCALGVVTAPPVVGAAWYWLLFWFRELRSSGAASIDVLEAARWHPGIDPDEILDNDDPVEVATFCLDRLFEHAQFSGWNELRASAIAGHSGLAGCSPELATWLDVGAFSRELAHRLASPTSALDALVASFERRAAPLLPETVLLLDRMVSGLRSSRARDTSTAPQHRDDADVSPVQGLPLLR